MKAKPVRCIQIGHANPSEIEEKQEPKTVAVGTSVSRRPGRDPKICSILFGKHPVGEPPANTSCTVLPDAVRGATEREL